LKILETDIKDLLIIEPDVFKDDRGYFLESFNSERFNESVGKKINFVQDNHSFSLQNTLRGLHYQLDPFAQGKLVRVVKGEVFDVAVDMRKNSSTFGMYIGVNLSDKNFKQFWIPEGFAHGFYVLSKTAHFLYKTTNFYNKESEASLVWNDRFINIEWPLVNETPNLSDKDKFAPSLNLTKYFY